MPVLTRLVALCLAGTSPALISVVPIAAEPQPAPAATVPPAGEAEVLDLSSDATARMTVPVNIQGQGPFKFIVDTGSERTVISRDLAQRLGLGAGTEARVHSMTEVSMVSTYIIPTLEVGGRKSSAIQAPGLERRNLGAEGMLGTDMLASKRVSFDFRRQQMTVVPSERREEHWADDAIVVRGRSRFGQLVLVDASVEGQKVWVIIDTGAQVSVGNSALRAKLERKKLLKKTEPISLLSVTGGHTMADWTQIKEIRLGGLTINNLPVAFADVHPFKKLQLTDKPAILLGMDALQLFDRVSVDFANREVRLLRPGRSDLNGTRMANGPRGRAAA
jgi:predicted aspartyl protease